MTDDTHAITMPKLGETVTEGTVNAWLRAVGDVIAFDDPLFEVSTDKVDSEVSSAYDGVLTEILVAAGTTVPVGTVLARIGEPGSAPRAESNGSSTPTAAVAPIPAQAATVNGRGPLSPVVRRLAAEHGIELAGVSGSGTGGRVTRADVWAVAAARPAGEATAVTSTPAASSAPAPPADRAALAPRANPALDDEVVALSRIRLVTVARMVESKRIAPHVWTSVEVDLESVETIRARHKERFRKEVGASLTYLPFIARAVCDALHAFPTVNASIDLDAKTMTLHRHVHLAIAVDLDEQGLVAPVVRNADELNLRGMARAIRAVGEGAKNRTLTSDDLTGSTFTLTNPGPLGSYASAAIINQPNVAIMSTEGVARRPVAVGDAIAVHHTCILGFSYDHRAFDGVTAARFLARVRDALQDRDWSTELGGGA